MPTQLRHATSEDMATIASICTKKIDDYPSRVNQALEAEDVQRKPLNLTDPGLYAEIVSVIEDYCSDNNIDPQELIPEDIIYTRTNS